jgi:hypothetical protein
MVIMDHNQKVFNKWVKENKLIFNYKKEQIVYFYQDLIIRNQLEEIYMKDQSHKEIIFLVFLLIKLHTSNY